MNAKEIAELAEHTNGLRAELADVEEKLTVALLVHKEIADRHYMRAKQRDPNLDALWLAARSGLKDLPEGGHGEAHRMPPGEAIAAYRSEIARRSEDCVLEIAKSERMAG